MAITKQINPVPLDPELTARFYEDGRWRFRKPEPIMIGPGRDANSYDFRGVSAASNVLSLFADEYPGSVYGHPHELKAHMDLGLVAISENGFLPLAGDFVSGYRRMTEAFVANNQRLAE
jgi:hypothetical protein